jgi:hypothetical protein
MRGCGAAAAREVRRTIVAAKSALMQELRVIEETSTCPKGTPMKKWCNPKKKSAVPALSLAVSQRREHRIVILR